MTLPSDPSRRTLRALDFMTVLPKLTCPSPAITTLSPLRTARMVVPRQDDGWEEDRSWGMKAKWRTGALGSSREAATSDIYMSRTLLHAGARKLQSESPMEGLYLGSFRKECHQPDPTVASSSWKGRRRQRRTSCFGGAWKRRPYSRVNCETLS